MANEDYICDAIRHAIMLKNKLEVDELYMDTNGVVTREGRLVKVRWTGDRGDQSETVLTPLHPRVVEVRSHTHYGRGTPPTGAKVEENLREVLRILDEVVPGLAICGHCDEDYGWVAEVTTEQEAAILSRYPDSMVESDITYLHKAGTEFGDMFTNDWEVHIYDYPHSEVKTCQVERTFDGMFSDWYENYGRH